MPVTDEKSRLAQLSWWEENDLFHPMVENRPIKEALRDAGEIASYGFAVKVEIPFDKELRKKTVKGNTMTESKPLYVVRLWDGFDGEWMDVSDPLPKEEAETLCKRKNKDNHGREDGNYNDIDYYATFPADTKMYFSEGRSQTRGDNRG